jgi:hypothetical protein
MPRYGQGTGKKNQIPQRRKGIKHGTTAVVSVSTPSPVPEGVADDAQTLIACPVSARSDWVEERTPAPPPKVLFPAQDTKGPATELRRSERAAVGAVPPAASPVTPVPPAQSQVVVAAGLKYGYRLSTPAKPEV